MSSYKIAYSLFIVLFSIFCFSACQIDEKIQFNEDFGGSYEIHIDMSEMISYIDEMMKEMESAFSEGDEKNKKKDKKEEESPEPDFENSIGQVMSGGMKEGLDEISNEIDSVENVWGVENLEFDLDSLNYNIRISFDFPDLKALNNFYADFITAMESSEGVNSETETFERVILEGNKLIIKAEPDNNESEEDAASSEMVGGMTEMFKISNHYTFPKKVKSVSNSAFKVDGNIVSFKGSLDEMIESGWDKQDLIIEFFK